MRVIAADPCGNWAWASYRCSYESGWFYWPNTEMTTNKKTFISLLKASIFDKLLISGVVYYFPTQWYVFQCNASLWDLSYFQKIKLTIFISNICRKIKHGGKMAVFFHDVCRPSVSVNAWFLFSNFKNSVLIQLTFHSFDICFIPLEIIH